MPSSSDGSRRGRPSLATSSRIGQCKIVQRAPGRSNLIRTARHPDRGSNRGARSVRPKPRLARDVCAGGERGGSGAVLPVRRHTARQGRRFSCRLAGSDDVKPRNRHARLHGTHPTRLSHPGSPPRPLVRDRLREVVVRQPLERLSGRRCDAQAEPARRRSHLHAFALEPPGATARSRSSATRWDSR